jgi:tRNA (uracil-5-)-methyltransferase
MPLSRIDPSAYEQLLTEKVARVRHLMAPLAVPEPEVYSSPTLGFRMRAEFRVWHDGDNLDYVMFRPEDRKVPVPVMGFPIACEAITSLMPRLIQCLRVEPILRRKLFQVEFLSTLTGDTLVSLIYHRRLEDDWETSATQLAGELGISIVGRSRGQKRVIGRDHVVEELSINDSTYTYHQYEQAFTQPNAMVNIQMIEWACTQAGGMPGNLLELYCGNGNFTLPLSTCFDEVIATELSKSSVRAARENLELNAVNNVEIIRLAAEEVTQAMLGEREFRRLAHLPRALAEYDLQSLFVDPPRAGLDSGTVAMAAGFPSILYISCNPDTLAANLGALCKTHVPKVFALFDQFPYTDHMECGVLLEQR